MNAKKDNKLCSCERESTDELCYKKKIDPTEKNMYYALLADMNNERNRYNKSVKICLHPISGECSSEKSGAHTISNSNVLKLIASGSTVMMPVMYNFEKDIQIKPLSIDNATKLNCFCKKHDEMFHTGGRILFRGAPLPPAGAGSMAAGRIQMVFQDPFSSLDPRCTVGTSVLPRSCIASWQREQRLTRFQAAQA